MAVIVFFGGMILSLYHAFSTRQKSKRQKFMMVFFAVVVNALAAIFAGSYLYNYNKGIYLIFPIINILEGIILLTLFRIGKINETAISDDNSNWKEITIGSSVLLIIIYSSHFLLRHYWAVTFSIAVAYATSFNEFVKNLYSEIKT